MDTPEKSPERAAQQTIAAIATPPGRGGIGVVRISGPFVPSIAEAVLGRMPAPRRAVYCPFRDRDGNHLDSGIAIYFPAPRSFTGEDVLELQGHGGAVVMDLLLQRVTELGARIARPGEFSERAFLNERMDLAQAEAVADLIDAASADAARSAMRSLEGEFSGRVNALVQRLTELRTYVEAAIDFPEEEIDFLADAALRERFAALAQEIDVVVASARQGCLMREGMTVVIAGRPNAGKSSLLNRLAGDERAIVTHIAGTTRDVLREHISIDGLPLHMIDTAGLRESRDPVERIGVERAWSAIEQADRVLLILDGTKASREDRSDFLRRIGDPRRCTIVHNKIDLTGQAPRHDEHPDGSAELWLSAKTGEGIELLRGHLKDAMGYRATGEGAFTARRRHVDALERARGFLKKGSEQLEENGFGELAAEDLRQAQNALGEITGEVTSDDLLGEIFASFCIGK